MPHSHAAAYAATPGVTVVAVCDLVPELVQRFQQEWHDSFPRVQGYFDYKEMLAEEEIELLSVATSDHAHAQIVVDAAAAGVRGIFCEKPIATSLADADRMIAACRKHNVPLLIDHSRRWYPEYVEARRIIRSGEMGELRRILATLGGPRAMLFRNGTHLIDTICFFAESEPEWVVGELDDEHHDYGPQYAGDGGHDPATDPGGSAYIHFRNGVRAFINASKRTMRNFELDLLTEKGRIRIGTHVAEMWHDTDTWRPSVAPLPRVHTTRSGTAAAVQELIDLAEHGGRGSSSGEDARRVLAVLLAILQSSDAGSVPVTIPAVDS